VYPVHHPALERLGVAVTYLDAYSGGAGLESRPEHQVSFMMFFMFFLIASR
jgi:hypothetical protein